MVSEKICLEILTLMLGKRYTVRTLWNEDAPSVESNIRECVTDDAVTYGYLYRNLLASYKLEVIDAAIRWLKYGEYLGEVYRDSSLNTTRVQTDQTRRLPEKIRPL